MTYPDEEVNPYMCYSVLSTDDLSIGDILEPICQLCIVPTDYNQPEVQVQRIIVVIDVLMLEVTTLNLGNSNKRVWVLQRQFLSKMAVYQSR